LEDDDLPFAAYDADNKKSILDEDHDLLDLPGKSAKFPAY
jgi:hypothetical protein